MKLCVRCGIEFESSGYDKICPDCKNKPKRASFKKLNEKLLEDVRQADMMKISYGKYKGGEGNWKLKIARSAVKKSK